MNQYKSVFVGVCLSLFFTGCSDFFKESSQDLIKPSSTEDLAAVMYKEAYPYIDISESYLNILTDEIQCNGLTSATYSTWYENGTPLFTYDENMFDGVVNFPNNANSWKIYYDKIKGCNVIKDYLDKVVGTSTDKNALLGQVLFLRAYYYLKLAAIYCQPYSAPGVNPETAMGLPLILSMEVTDNNPYRNTLAETYAQIESDLLEAAELLKNNYVAETKFRVGHVAAYMLLSRMYLYMGRNEDMVKAVTYSDLAMEEGPELTTISSFASSTGTYRSTSIYDDASTEVVWKYGTKTYTSTDYWGTNSLVSGSRAPYTISASLESKYDQANDIRYKLYIRGLVSGTTPSTFVYKVSNTTLYYGDHGLRMAEVYLNRAEALIRQYAVDGDENKRAKAMLDLNNLRRSRFVLSDYVDADITNADELLQFCIDERQREYCWESGFRWFDIKRLGLSVTHTYIDSDGIAVEYTLEANDPLYALPIPHDAITRNLNLKQNPR